VTSPESKTVLARSTNPARWVGATLAGTPFAAGAGQQDRSDVDGTLRLYGQSTIQSTRWRVFAGANLSDTTRTATRLFEQELAILLSGLAVVAIGTLWTYRRLTVPIHQLRESIRLATARLGNVEVRVQGPTEVAELAVDFNVLIASVARELAERQRAEDEIRSLNAELEARVSLRTEQLTAANQELEAFSYSVAHDLRAPLRAVDGFTAIVIEEHTAELSDAARRYLDMVREGTRQMSALINDLLEFARLSRAEIHTQSVDLLPLVEKAVLALRSEFPGRDVEVTIGPLPHCRGDRALLERVVVNLLSNAFKYTGRKEGAAIVVGAELNKGSGEVIYFVKDNGAGFDAKHASKLFGVFQRLHRAEDYPGTGIGLAIVQRIVRRHGGAVWAESEPELGAKFSFTLGDMADD
jgi:signal transduction histidine kinase